MQAGAVIPGVGQHLAMVDLAGSYSVPDNSQNNRNINFSQRLFPRPGKSPAKPPVFKKPLPPAPPLVSWMEIKDKNPHSLSLSSTRVN